MKRLSARLHRYKALTAVGLLLFLATIPKAMATQWSVESGNYYNGYHSLNPTGSYSNVTGVIQIDEPRGQWSLLYDSIPQGDFNVSLDVKAESLNGFALFLRSDLPFAGSTHGVNLEFGPRDGGTFLLARWVNGGGWVWDNFAYGLKENTWYTIKLAVQENPYNITASAYDSNGTLLGSYSAIDIGYPPFSALQYFGFGASENGGNYTVRNIVLNPSGPIKVPPSPTPTPIPTPTEAPLPKPNLAMTCQSSATPSNLRVEIGGNLTYNGTPLSNVPLLLSYSVNMGASWIDLTTVGTDDAGAFSAVWMPTVTGTYLLKATFSGDANYSEANTIVNFAIVPTAQQSTFSVISNSTLSAFAFNSTSNQVSFTVTGPSGTTGYVNIEIPKSLVANISSLQVFLDGAQQNYNVQEESASWIISIAYHHSSHEITVSLNPPTQTSPPTATLGGQWAAYAAFIVVVVLIVAVALIVLRNRKKDFR